MKVVEANEVTDEIVKAFTRLIPQLSSKSRIPSASELGEIVSSDASILLLAYDGDRIVGSLALVMFHGERRAYFLYFLRGEDGVWRIESM